MSTRNSLCAKTLRRGVHRFGVDAANTFLLDDDRTYLLRENGSSAAFITVRALPLAFDVGLVVGPQIIDRPGVELRTADLRLPQHAQINVRTRAEIVEDTCTDRVCHQCLSFLLLY